MGSLWKTLLEKMNRSDEKQDSLQKRTYAATKNGKRIRSLEVHLRNGIPLEEGLWPHQVLLLDRIGTLTKKNAKIESYWWRDCGMKDEDITVEIQRLKQNGYLERMPAYDLLMLDTAKELKEILEVYGLSQSGKKEELADRICSVASEEEIYDLYYEHPYVCSEKGRRVLEKYAMIPYLQKHPLGGITIWEIAGLVPAGKEDAFKVVLWDEL